MRRLLVLFALAVAPSVGAASADPLNHFSDHGVSFDYPATWTTYETPYRGLHWIPLVYLSSQAMHEPCVAIDGGLTCGPPVDALGENSAVAGWSRTIAPPIHVRTRTRRRRRLSRHNAVTIDGMRVRFYRSYPGCPAIGGDESIVLGVPRPAGVELWACLRGPQLDLVERQLFTILRSTKFDAGAVPWR